MSAFGLTPRRAFIVGPTGVGKSELALTLAERLGAEIVNADSRQLYRAMDIGTAKPTLAQRARVPHHLIDVVEPEESVDVARFKLMAEAAIGEIAGRGRPILIVGGSGLYLRALRQGLFQGPPAAPALRRELMELARREGVDRLHRSLMEIDPPSARRLHRNDLARVVRALEVYRLTGVPLSVHQAAHRFSDRFAPSLTLGLRLEREELYRSLERRLDAMMEAGLVGEVNALLARGLAHSPLLRHTIGYREIAAALAGEMSLAQALEQAKRATRQLAKRQMTWFRADPGIIWLAPGGALAQGLKLLQEFFSPTLDVHPSDATG
ncbi:MAG TPA: tRNA (adenosine(37)-N6)-dimethylallyltransferase MiaA [Candidatus Binataceae bacterium]|nr:tRNA (adenosine(37)-N6)-dimethylallyltransferase MiaA [Candidatus Binataceae bacterium]